MSKKVKTALFTDTVGIAINIFITFILCALCDKISYDIIEIISKTIIIVISTIINIIITFFFLLYWWSDITWNNCKRKCRRVFKRK